MKRIPITKTLVVLCLASTGVFLILASRKSSEKADNTFPTKTDTRQYLQAEGGDETARVVDYYPDGWTEKSVTVEYTNGGELKTTFFEDGSPNELVEYFPPNEKEERILKRTISYAKGSPAVIVSAKFYRPDGTLLAQGGIRANGTYEQFQYDSTGASIERHEVFLTTGQIVYRKGFDPSVPETHVEKIDSGPGYTVSFREDGTRHQRMREFEQSYNELFEFFSSDGLTRDYVVFRYDKIGVVYLNSDGSLAEARKFGTGKFQVVIYRPGLFPEQSDFANVPTNGAKYKQYWSDGNGEKPVLTQVDEYRSNGTVWRSLYFDDNELSKAEYRDSEGKVAHTVVLKMTEEDNSSSITLVIPGLTLSVPEVKFRPEITELTDRVDPRPSVGHPVGEYFGDEYYDEEYYHMGGGEGYPYQVTLDFP